jgi:hypothetical protein
MGREGECVRGKNSYRDTMRIGQSIKELGRVRCLVGCIKVERIHLGYAFAKHLAMNHGTFGTKKDAE